MTALAPRIRSQHRATRPFDGPLALAAGLCATMASADPGCETTQTTPGFAGFDNALKPVLAKRLCGQDIADDALAIATYIAAQGCADDSPIALAVSELLTHPEPQDFIAEFGAYQWDAIPEDKRKRFCDTAAAVDLGKALSADPGTPDPAVKKAYTAFFEAAHAIKED